MGLRRDNRARQRLGRLLDLTKQQQEQRQEWQANRKPDWTDRMIVAPSVPDGVMSWGFCRVFDFTLLRFTHIDMPGSMRVSPVGGRSQVVRTDTTDRMSRAKRTVRRLKNGLMGD